MFDFVAGFFNCFFPLHSIAGITILNFNLLALLDQLLQLKIQVIIAKSLTGMLLHRRGLVAANRHSTLQERRTEIFPLLRPIFSQVKMPQ